MVNPKQLRQVQQNTVRNAFLEISQDNRFHNKGITTNVWLELIKERYKDNDFLNQQIDEVKFKAILKKCNIISTTEDPNEHGLFCNTRRSLQTTKTVDGGGVSQRVPVLFGILATNPGDKPPRSNKPWYHRSNINTETPLAWTATKK